MGNENLEKVNKNVEELKDKIEELTEQIKDVRTNSLIITQVSSSVYHMQFKMNCIDTTLDNIERVLNNVQYLKNESTLENVDKNLIQTSDNLKRLDSVERNLNNLSKIENKDYLKENNEEPNENKTSIKDTEVNRIIDILEKFERRIYKLEKCCEIEK